jgi:MYXO-CTERM domain-containing protein
MVRSTLRVTRRLLPALALLALSLAVAPSALAADHVVKVVGFAFAPQTVTVAVGDTVTWTNGDNVTHTATADDASFDTGSISGGSSSVGVTFNTIGTFAYHCRIHASMTASIVVASAPPATDTLDPVTAPSDATPLGILALAAFGGLVIGRRRFNRSVEAPTRD